MWSAKENDGRVFLLINGERAINKQSEELQIKKIFKGKTSNELIVEFEGGSERRTLIASQYEQYEDMTPEGIVKMIMSLIGEETYPQAKTTKKRGKKRRFLEGSEIDSCSIPQSLEDEMDGSISRKRKGTQLIPVQELACFDPDFCPRWQKEGWVSHLKEAFRKSQHEEVNIPVIQKEVEFEGGSERRTLIASQYEQYEDMTPEGIVKMIMSLIGEETYPQAKTTKKRGKKRRFLEGSEIDSCSIPQSLEDEMDGSISRKRKGTQLIPVQELACFDPDFCPRWQKEGWVSHLKEAFRKSQHEEVNIPVIQKEV